MQSQLLGFGEVSTGPSTRPQSSNLSWIPHICQQVKTSPGLRLILLEPVPVLVVAVQRYLRQGFGSAYCYDVSIWDGTEQDTWHLSSELNHLVHRNVLRSGSQARITHCSYMYREKSLGSGLVCIEELEPGEEMAGHQFTDHVSVAKAPLLWDRKHYLPLWNNEDPYGDIWKGPKQPDEQVNVDVYRIFSLQRLEMIWRSKITFPPLLVRIIYKGRLHYFGKPDKRLDMPYLAYFGVADFSGIMSVILWNEVCPEWFSTLQVGTVILLQHYSVKIRYSKRILPDPVDSQMKRFSSIEICLNARDPPSSIRIISEKLVKPEWRLPSVTYQFVTRMELNGLPHERFCDVIGLVTYAGRCERKRHKDDKEDFSIYRWVQMIDGTTEQPFLLEIFATSQPDIFEHIHPMSYLVCTQMRVVQETPDDTAYLTTSYESQIFISGYHRGQPYITDTKVKNFIAWMRTQSEVDLSKKTVIGGYHPYPLTPDTFPKYCRDNKVDMILKTFSELKETIENLHYREHKRIAIQGIIAALRYVDSISVPGNTSESEHQEQSVSLEGNSGQLTERVEKGPQPTQSVLKEHSELPLHLRGDVQSPQDDNNHASPVKRRKLHQLVETQKRYFTRSATRINNDLVVLQNNSFELPVTEDQEPTTKDAQTQGESSKKRQRPSDPDEGPSRRIQDEEDEDSTMDMESAPSSAEEGEITEESGNFGIEKIDNLIKIMRKTLGLSESQKDLNFKVLPFGLATAPRVFTKILAVVMGVLRLRGIRIVPYLDDMLLIADSPQQASVNTQTCLDLLKHLANEDSIEVVENEIRKSSDSWESSLWSDVKVFLEEHLHYSTIFPESIPRKFDYVHKEFLMQQSNLHPAKLSEKLNRPERTVHEFTPATSCGYYEVTILGINQKVAVDVLYLPVLCSDDAYVVGMNCLPNNDQLLCGSDPPPSHNTEGMSQQRLPLQGELLKFVNAKDKPHVICILDICHLGEDKVEVFLNRVYNPVNTLELEKFS
ncbi:RPA-related protein RADX [Rhinophrynus dorsalis]